MKVLAGIVLYQPDTERLTENINAIRNQVDAILLVDNGSNNLDKVKEISGDTVFYIENGANLGIAAALNKIMRYAAENGYEWVLTLDQDSVCNEGLVDEYRKYTYLEDAGVMTCRILDRHLTEDEMSEEQSEDVREAKRCITSASFCSVKAYLKTKGFDEWLFIDWVDFDYCAQIRKIGYKVYRVNFVGMIHEIGHGKTVKLLHRHFNVYNHSAFRHYYINRNRLYVAKMYPEEYSVPNQFKKVIKDIILVTLYETDKTAKLKAIFKGVRDYRKRLMDVSK